MAKSVRNSTRSDPLDPFDDRVDMLFEELELAVKWNRPSILLAVYQSEFLQADLERVLNARLAEIGIKVVHLLVTKAKFDLPLELIKQPELEKTVFFISGLRLGGGKSDGNAFRALNIRREYLVDYKIRTIFWLTEAEAAELPFRAPDFWSFRHRVIEFIDTPALVFSTMISPSQPVRKQFKAPENIDGQIELQASLLAQLSAAPEAVSERLALLLILGNLYWLKGELKKASESLSTALVLARFAGSVDLQFRALIGLGVVEYDAGWLMEAASTYQQACRVDPNSFIPWLYLNVIYSRLGDPRRSLFAAKKASRLNQSSAEAWFALGNLYAERKRYGEAITAFQKSLILEKKNARAWENLGEIYLVWGNLGAAIDVFEKSVKLEPENGMTLGKLSMLYRNSGEIQNALKTAKKAVKKAPRASYNWIILGSILALLGRFEEAILTYSRAATLEPDNLLAAISLADCFQKTGELEQSLHWRLFAASLMPFKDDYLAACFCAISIDRRAALRLLRSALRKRQVSPDWLQQDPIFEFLRAEQGFQRLLDL